MPHNRNMREQIRGHVTGFVEFVRERGVVGLAIGFVLGGAVQKLVTALVTDVINPLLAFVLGSADLARFSIGPFLIGDFLSVLIDFLILVAIVYLVFKVLRLDTLDKQKKD